MLIKYVKQTSSHTFGNSEKWWSTRSKTSF